MRRRGSRASLIDLFRPLRRSNGSQCAESTSQLIPIAALEARRHRNSRVHFTIRLLLAIHLEKLCGKSHRPPFHPKSASI